MSPVLPLALALLACLSAVAVACWKEVPQYFFDALYQTIEKRDGSLATPHSKLRSKLKARAQEPCAVDVESTLRRLLSSEEPPTLQVRALRRDLVRKLLSALDALDRDEIDDEASRWNGLPGPSKRNLEALARAGYLRTRGDLEAAEDEEEVKRSIANLAKTGQLPVVQRQEGKRGIQSLARNGELHGKRQPKRELQSQQHPMEYDYDAEAAKELYGKRNIASLARNYELPFQGYDKRFLGSLARSGDLARFYGNSDKRNIASLAREGNWMRGKRMPLARVMNTHAYPIVDNHIAEETANYGERPTEDKRNIASIKAQYKPKFKRSAPGEEAGRQKRDVGNEWPEDASDEYLSPVFQNGHIPTMYDYEELLRELEQAEREADRTPEVDKRFLGRLPMMGKPKTTASPKPHPE